MLYPYFSISRGGETRLLPLIPISARGPKGTLDNALALVDSGAEQNVFGGDVAEHLGIRLEDGDEALITGVSGEPLSAGVWKLICAWVDNSGERQ
jgi:hypothetical protein